MAVGVILGGAFARIFLYNPNDIAISESTKSDLNALGIQNLSGIMPNEILGVDQIFTAHGFIFMMLGGFLVGFGARYAGGCTSGHGIMGLSMMRLSSIVVLASFFVGGLITTHLLLPIIL